MSSTNSTVMISIILSAIITTVITYSSTISTTVIFISITVISFPAITCIITMISIQSLLIEKH